MDSDATNLITPPAESPGSPAIGAGQPEDCPHCHSAIPIGELFCVRCGYERGTWQGARTAKKAPADRPASSHVLVAQDGQEYVLWLGETVAGRGDVDLQFADGFMSRRHALFNAQADAVTLRDLGSANGTFVGEQRIPAEETVPLSESDVVRIGQTVLRLRFGVAVEQPTEPPAVEPAVEEVGGMSDEERPAGLQPIGALSEARMEIAPALSPWSLAREGVQEFFLPYGESVLGRKPDKCQIVVRGDGFISGAHCRLIVTETTLEVEDLESTNGTFINGERIECARLYSLSAGDMLRLGQTELSVVFEPRAGAEAPEPEESELGESEFGESELEEPEPEALEAAEN